MLKKIANLLKSNSGAKPEPLVLQNAIWRELFLQLTAIGNGEYVLPSENILVVFCSSDDSARNILIAAFGDGRLEQFLRGKLHEERCRQANSINVNLDCVSERPTDWRENQTFKIEFNGTGRKINIPTVVIRILNGKASKKRFTFSKSVINFGRGAEPKDKHQTLVRKNDVAFLDISEEPNNYVSQLHAHIQYNPAERLFYLSDSGFEYGITTNGTRLFRYGNLIAKLNADQKIPLQNGDEIHLGKACIKFEIG